MSDEVLPAPQEKPDFSQFLRTINHGDFAEELTAELQTLVAKMVSRAETTGGKPKGELRFTLKLLLDRGIFEVDADVAVKEPKVVRQRQIMYGDRRGVLSPDSRLVQNPQTDAFRDVSTEKPGDVRRISNRSLAWSYHLVRADKVFDDAFKGARATIAAGTGLPVFMGAPES